MLQSRRAEFHPTGEARCRGGTPPCASRCAAARCSERPRSGTKPIRRDCSRRLQGCAGCTSRIVSAGWKGARAARLPHQIGQFLRLQCRELGPQDLVYRAGGKVPLDRLPAGARHNPAWQPLIGRPEEAIRRVPHLLGVAGRHKAQPNGIVQPRPIYRSTTERVAVGHFGPDRGRKCKGQREGEGAPAHSDHFIAMLAALSGSSSPKQRWKNSATVWRSNSSHLFRNERRNA